MTRLEWSIAVPLLGNRRVTSQLLKAEVIIVALFGLLIGMPLAVEGEWDALGRVVGGMAVVTAALLLVSTLVLVVMTRNRYHLSYRLDAKGALQQVVDPRARAVHRTAAVGGVLSGRPGVAAGGLIGLSTERRMTTWDQVSAVVERRRDHSIDLRNRWRTLVTIYCPTDRFDDARAFARERIAHAAGMAGDTGPGPLALAGWTVAVCLAAFPLFALPYPFRAPIALPLFLLVPALATVWLVPVFGWVTLAGAILGVGWILQVGYGDHGWSSLIYTEWIPVAWAVAGLLFLAWLGIRAGRGRGPTALYRDLAPGVAADDDQTSS